MSDPGAMPIVAELMAEVQVHVMTMALTAEAEEPGTSMFWEPGTAGAFGFEAGVNAGAAAMMAVLADRGWLSIPAEAVTTE